ncbi:MAG: hypothetical protein KDI13_09560 [Alphaproteobacteria bacterium]|nr:hypothetical protein [Alphaproteobacteria bacterium]
MRTNYSYTDKRQTFVGQEVRGIIAGLMGQLAKLAPHPSQPGYHGPLFINHHSAFKAADAQDGMLGSMLIESMIGGAFSAAASQAVSERLGEQAGDLTGSLCQSVDLSNALECYSEYITDIENDDEHRHKAAHGQGTLARLSGKPISGAFNLRSSMTEGMQAFLNDLPERMQIEGDLAYYARQLDHMAMPAPAFTSPAPLMAA